MSSHSSFLRRAAVGLFLAACAAPPAAPAQPVSERHDPRLLVRAPSEAVVGECVAFSVALQDEWGREGPPRPWGTVRAARLEVAATDSLAEVGSPIRLERADRGFRRAEIVFRTPGLQHIRVKDETGLVGQSNPVVVLASPPAERVYWGDLHGHLHTPGAGHSGAMDVDEYARYWEEGLAWARDGALLDFAAFTEHIQTAGGLARPGTDGRSPWDVALGAVETANSPNAFVVFPGFEWQGDEGDHCVILPAPGPLEAPADYRALVEVVRGRGALLTAHAVFLPDTFEEAPPELAAIEVTRDSKSTEWLGRNALARGVVRPFLGCSDTHAGALGATSLTGLRAPALTRDKVRRAIRAGRCWATNGERIVLDFAVDDQGDLPRVAVRGVGTAPIERIEIWRDGSLVAEAQGFPSREEFEFLWEDDGLLRPDAIAGPLAYHVRVVQVSANRYDPGERDLAISSPVLVTPTPRHFDAAHARRNGRADAAPGAALELVRDAWGRLAAAPDRPLRADPAPGATLPTWRADEIASLRTAVQQFTRLAARDTALAPLARTLDVLPEVARVVDRAGRLEARLREALVTSAPTPAALRKLRDEVDEVRTDAATAGTRLHSEGRNAVTAAWFAPRALDEAPARLVRLVEAFAELPERPAAVVRGGSKPVDRLMVPIDPRTAAEVGALAPRAVELQGRHEEAWGYTSRSPAPGNGEGAMRLRVVAEGNPRSARLSGGGIAPGSWIPFRAERGGWVAELDRVEVPAGGETPLEISFDPPTRVGGVFLEASGGAPLRVHGHVRRLEIAPAGDASRVTVQVEEAPVVAELVARSAGPADPGGAARVRILWTGTLEPGSSEITLPNHALDFPADVWIRWGFGGWRRVAGVEVPGHDVARPLGFGALSDGRGAIALEEGLMLVSPEAGTTTRVPYPEGVRLERGRVFGAAPTGEGTVIRGARGAGGGWALRLTPEGDWRPVAPGPEAGTVAADPNGGIAWLVGAELWRRGTDGGEAGPSQLEAAGQLLAIDPGGRALVRVASGEVVREDPGSGRIVERIPGPLLGVDGSGGALELVDLNRRHAEIATGVRVVRHLGEEGRRDTWPMAIKTMPVGDSPLLCAAAPDGSLLALGGAIEWRRGPANDWWGATVERWEPIWAGETRPR